MNQCAFPHVMFNLFLLVRRKIKFNMFIKVTDNNSEGQNSPNLFWNEKEEITHDARKDTKYSYIKYTY